MLRPAWNPSLVVWQRFSVSTFKVVRSHGWENQFAFKGGFMKVDISKFVVVAAIAVLLVVGGSTAAWAQCPTSPNYVSNFNSDHTCLTQNSSSAFFTPVEQPTILRLTPAVGGQAGSAWFTGSSQSQLAFPLPSSSTYCGEYSSSRWNSVCNTEQQHHRTGSGRRINWLCGRGRILPRRRGHGAMRQSVAVFPTASLLSSIRSFNGSRHRRLRMPITSRCRAAVSGPGPTPPPTVSPNDFNFPYLA